MTSISTVETTSHNVDLLCYYYKYPIERKSMPSLSVAQCSETSICALSLVHPHDPDWCAFRNKVYNNAHHYMQASFVWSEISIQLDLESISKDKFFTVDLLFLQYKAQLHPLRISCAKIFYSSIHADNPDVSLISWPLTCLWPSTTANIKQDKTHIAAFITEKMRGKDKTPSLCLRHRISNVQLNFKQVIRLSINHYEYLLLSIS